LMIYTFLISFIIIADFALFITCCTIRRKTILPMFFVCNTQRNYNPSIKRFFLIDFYMDFEFYRGRSIN
jgi:hypothetical protein